MPRPSIDQRVEAMAAMEESAALNGGKPRFHQLATRLRIHGTTLQRWWEKAAADRATRAKLHLLPAAEGDGKKREPRDPRHIEPWEFAFAEFGELDALLAESLDRGLTTQVGKLFELRRQAYETTRVEWEKVEGPAKKDRSQIEDALLRAAERMSPDMLEKVVAVAKRRGLVA